MTLKCSLLDAANGLDAKLAGVNNNPDPGEIRLYSGAVPASLADAPGTLLATCVLADGTTDAFAASTTTDPVTAVGALTGGVFAFDPAISPGGTPTYFRLYDSTGVARLQGTAGISGTDLILDSPTLASGGTLTIDQFDPFDTTGA